MPKHPEQEWLDYPRAVDYLHKKIPGGFTRRALEKVKREGDIRFTKIRGRIWFHQTDLDAYINMITRTDRAS
jgi:hypothetical protein